MQPAIAKKLIWEILGTTVTALIYLSFVFGFARNYRHTHDTSVLLFALFDTVVIMFLFIRGLPVRSSNNPVYWAAAMGGTWSTLFMRPYPDLPGLSPLLFVQIIGLLISFAGLLSLNKSFGLMASNRVIRTKGMYRYIRHPLYAGYFITTISFAIQHVSVWNIAVTVFHIVI